MAHRMLKPDLRYHPYKMPTVQELKETVFASWKDFCEEFLCLQLPEDAELFSCDEAYFELNGNVNK